MLAVRAKKSPCKAVPAPGWSAMPARRRSLRRLGAALPAVPAAASARRVNTAEEEAEQPEDNEHDQQDPQQVDCEAKSTEQHDYQQQDQ